MKQRKSYLKKSMYDLLEEQGDLPEEQYDLPEEKDDLSDHKEKDDLPEEQDDLLEEEVALLGEKDDLPEEEEEEGECQHAVDDGGGVEGDGHQQSAFLGIIFVSNVLLKQMYCEPMLNFGLYFIQKYEFPHFFRFFWWKPP